jgi:predicted acyl esterase
MILLGLFGILLPAYGQEGGGREARLVAQVGKLLIRFDTDADGSLSNVERSALLKLVNRVRGKRVGDRVQAMLEKADADGDGIVSSAEWKAYADAVAEEAKKTAARKQTVMVPMSDEVKLATDVYVPDGEGPFPVVFMRTPYNKNVTAGVGRNFNTQGYVFVVQDQRGRFESEGENIPFVGCGWTPTRDGAETLAWIRKQSWCNGKVCTVGGSALGITQNLMAGAVPEGLTAQYIQVAAASLYHHAAYVGGALRKSQVEGWITGNKYDPKALQLMREHPTYDDYWRNFDSLKKHSVMNVPAVHFGGWFDTFALGTVEAFRARQHGGAEGAKGKQKLVMGPWDHGGWRKKKIGELRFPGHRVPEAYDWTRWLEYHLKGADNGIMTEPAVAYYVMGDTSDPESPGNEWRFASDWPVPAKATPFYFRTDGTLSVEKSEEAEAVREYTFDPGDPCPTIGGCNLVLPKGPRNQNKIESRKDVLTFTTAALTEPVEVTGHAKACVWIASSAVDTDLSIRLCDVYPDGRSYLMAEGMLRLRYRESFEKPLPLEPGTTTEVKVECWPTSIVFNVGHRIRVTVTSSNHPRFDVNPGTGQPWTEGAETVKQTNRIGCGGAASSCIVLPVVPPAPKKKEETPK